LVFDVESAKMRHAAFLAMAILIAGCGRGQGTEVEQKLVDRFHSELDKEQYAQIYAERDKLFRTPEAQYIRLLTTVHRKLGNVRGEHLDAVTTAVNPQGTFVVLRYATQFERGTATETFSWHLVGDSAKLTGYFIERGASVKK